jgi:hypothetical protein
MPDELTPQTRPGRSALEQDLDAALTADSALRAQLLSSPHDAIERATGVRPPADLPVLVLEEHQHLFVLAIRKVPPGPPGPNGDTPRMALERRLYELLAADAGPLLASLHSDPATFLRGQLGLELPAGVTVRIVEDGPNANVIIRFPGHVSR